MTAQFNLPTIITIPPTNFKTNYQRLSHYTTSSISSHHITHDDDTSLPTTNIATPFGIQKLFELDHQKQNIIILSKNCYQYDSPFHSSDSDMYAPPTPSSHNTHSNVSAKPSTSIQIQTHPITKKYIPCISTQHLPGSSSYTSLHSDHRPQQRLFNPMKHQQGA